MQKQTFNLSLITNSGADLSPLVGTRLSARTMAERHIIEDSFLLIPRSTVLILQSYGMEAIVANDIMQRMKRRFPRYHEALDIMLDTHDAKLSITDVHAIRIILGYSLFFTHGLHRVPEFCMETYNRAARQLEADFDTIIYS